MSVPPDIRIGVSNPGSPGNNLVSRLDVNAATRIEAVERGVDHVSLRGLGADHTGAVAADAFFAQALADGRPIDLGGLENTFKLASPVITNSDLVLVGKGARVDLTAVASVDNRKSGIRVEGSVGAKVLLGANANKRERSVTVASAAGFAVNDWVEIGSDGPRTTLASPIADATTTANIVLTDASAFAAAGRILVDGEVIAYTGKATNTLSGITRGQNGTTGAAHSSGATTWEQTSAAYFPSHGTNPAVDRGEKKQIHAIVGNTITFRQYLYDDYPTSRGAFLRKLTMPKAHISGVEFISDNDTGTDQEYGVDLLWCNDVKVDVDTSNLNTQGVRLRGCIRAKISGARFRGPDNFAGDTPIDNTYYGVGLYDACQWIRVYGCHAEHLRRLGVTSAHSAGQDFYGCPRFVVVSTCTAQNLRVEMWEHHGFGEKIRVENISCDGCDGLVRVEGPGITVDGGQVHNWRKFAISLSADLIDATDITIRDIDIFGVSVTDAFASPRAVSGDLSAATTIKDVWLEDIRVHEWTQLALPAIDIDGTVTAQNSGCRGCRINGAGTRTSYIMEINPPGWLVEGGSIIASGFGIRLNGDSNRVKGTHFELSDTSAGPAVLLSAPNQHADFCEGVVGFSFASIASGATEWTVENNAVKTPLNSRCIGNTSSVVGRARNNSWQLGSGDFSAVSASSLTLPCMGSLYWRVTGTTAIDNIVKMADGTVIWIEATGALPINNNTAAPPATHGAIKLNGGANITLAVDKVIALACRSGTWRQIAVA